MLDVFYHTKANRDRVQQQGGQLLHVIRKNLQRNKKKLKKLSNELKATENADEYRIKGEVLTTYLYQIKCGMTKIALHSFYNKKKQQKSKHSSRVKINKPESYIASDGTEILVGKNNLQNEKLTLHTAKKTDIWLHAKNIPGSHVIIKSNNPSDETLFEAAML